MMQMLNEKTLGFLINTGIDIQSYLLLKEGIKPVIRMGLGQGTVETAKKSAEKLGLEIMIKEFTELYGGKLPEKIINAYYSLDKNLCEQAWKTESEGDRKKFGQLLGYPDCCIENFIQNLVNGIDYTLISFRNVKSVPSFYCNNIFVFDSKLSNIQLRRFYDNQKIVNGPRSKNLFLIRHVPCSFDCKESVKIGKITLKILENNLPNLAEEVVNVLKKPVLYWNYFEWIILNGHQKDDTIRYDGVLNYESLISSETKRMIENGNKISIGDEKITIFDGNAETGEIPRKDGIPVCIDFQ